MRFSPIHLAVAFATLPVAAAPTPAASQVVLTQPASLPRGPSELLIRLGLVRAELKALLQRYDSMDSRVLASIRGVQAREDTLARLGYSPRILALRDTVEQAERALAQAIPSQETEPAHTHRLAAWRDALRERYWSLAPPEPYCQEDPPRPVMPEPPADRGTPTGAG